MHMFFIKDTVSAISIYTIKYLFRQVSLTKFIIYSSTYNTRGSTYKTQCCMAVAWSWLNLAVLKQEYIPVKLGQWNGCWCTDSLCHPVTNSDGTDCLRYKVPCFPRGRVSTTCATSVLSNDKTHTHTLRHFPHSLSGQVCPNSVEQGDILHAILIFINLNVRQIKKRKSLVL